MRALVIVDREGRMADYLKVAVEANRLTPADVLLFDDSLEASNATAEELIVLARRMIGTLVAEDPSIAQFALEPAELALIHRDRIARSSRGNQPGLADMLLREVQSRTDGRARPDKLALVEALADFLWDELKAVLADEPSEREEALHRLKDRRPIVGFVLDQIIPAINRPMPAGHSP